MECSYRATTKATTWIGGLIGRLVGSLSGGAVRAWLACALAFAFGCASTWTGSVGAVLAKDNKDGRVFVREAPSDMPAASAGVQVDDEVMAVDGKVARDMSPEDLHQSLSGKVGTKVRLLVRHGGETREVLVERGPLKGVKAP